MTRRPRYPRWVYMMMENLNLKPETVNFSIDTPCETRSLGEGQTATVHTGFVSVTIQGWKNPPRIRKRSK